MKLLYLIYDDVNNPWFGGGGSTRCLEVTKRLAKRHEITILTGSYPKAKDELNSNPKTIHVGSGKNKITSRLSFLKGTKEFLLNNKPHFDLAIESFSAFSPTHLGKTKMPKVLIFHHRLGRHPFRKYWLFGIYPYLAETRALESFQDIIAGNRSLYEELRQTYPKKNIACITPGINIPQNPQRAYKDFCLFLGRFDIYMKGLDILVRAAKIALKTNKDFKLVIAGKGNAKKVKDLIAKSGAAKAIELKVNVSDEEKKWLLANCRFLCMPSRFEGWGITALEAQSFGKAVVGTDVPGLRDCVLNGKTGMLVLPENPSALAQAIGRLWKNEAMNRALGENALAWAKNFSWDKIAEQEEDFYRAVLERDGRAT